MLDLILYLSLLIILSIVEKMLSYHLVNIGIINQEFMLLVAIHPKKKKNN